MIKWRQGETLLAAVSLSDSYVRNRVHHRCALRRDGRDGHTLRWD